MTLPDERYRAVMAAEELLKDLLDPKKTPRVPSMIRQRARHALRHYPGAWDMRQVSEACPSVFQERMDDLHKFLLKGKEINENRSKL